LPVNFTGCKAISIIISTRKGRPANARALHRYAIGGLI
jgi:hypothetical protein